MKRNKKGFTIVELVIVIGVIGILSAILIPTFVSLTSKAEGAAAKAECASAYTLYSAIAADKKIDEEEQKSLDPEATYSADITITYLTQDKVALKRGSKFYTWQDNKEWKEYDSTPTVTVVASDVAHSTFNGCVVYVK